VKRKLWIWGIVVAVVGVALWTLAPSTVDVETALVARGSLRVTIDEDGETRLRRRFVVSAPVAGRVLRIEARSGDRVKAGETVAVMRAATPTPLDARTEAEAQARVKAAGAAADRARADRARVIVERRQADADAARAKQLFEGGYGSREAWEQLDARARGLAQVEQAAESTIRAADFELAAARAALVSREEATAGRDVRVAAPIAGLVLRRLQESEGVVQAGTPLVEVGTLDDLEIVADLLSTDAVKVKPGAPVLIERWGGEGTLAGCVERVEPAGFMKISALGVEEQRVNVVIEFAEGRERRAALGDGYRVEVKIVIWEQQDALITPTSSLFRVGGEWAVFVVDAGVLRRRTVSIGHRNDSAAEVVGGLAAGDRVVTYPGESLADEMRVRAR
jgi:HlyD family secretion protein